MQYDEFRAMNSAILLAASEDDPAQVEMGFRQAQRFIEEGERRFTRFAETSELSQLNRAAGNWFQVSDDMFLVLELAQRLAFETDGLFNPAILPALKQAGYDRSMDELRNSAPRPALPFQMVETHDFRQIQLDPRTKSALLPPGMQIDLGGIAKGWIAEQAARQLAQTCETCAVSAGGDMFLIGLSDGEPTWKIGLEDPLEPENDLELLSVKPGAVATSSIAKRTWQHNGQFQHHLIDPRSGKPAQTEWISVTVWAEHAAEAEVYAKTLLIAGPQGAAELLNHHPQTAYLAVDPYRLLHGSANAHEVFHV
jgi:thiamine biosynthesis lipoprotein